MRSHHAASELLCDGFAISSVALPPCRSATLPRDDAAVAARAAPFSVSPSQSSIILAARMVDGFTLYCPATSGMPWLGSNGTFADMPSSRSRDHRHLGREIADIGEQVRCHHHAVVLGFFSIHMVMARRWHVHLDARYSLAMRALSRMPSVARTTLAL